MTNARPSFVSPRGAPSIDMAFSMVQDDSNNSSSSSSSASHFATMFRQALTTAVSCGSTCGVVSTTTHGKGSIFSDLDCLGLLTTAPKKRSRPDARRRRRRGVTTVADQEARKILSLLSEQLSASKAILLDAETISILLERLLA